MRAALFVAVVVAAQLALGAASIIDPQIVGGQEAQPHQFPWQVAIKIHLDGGVGFCGGSLVAKRWVLTAAHCASPGKKVDKFEVILGAHEINSESESDRAVFTVKGSDAIIGDEWKGILSGSLAGDIALLPLSADAPLKEGVIEIVRLPSAEQKNESFWRKTVTISGWGKENTGDKHVAPKLRFTSNKVVSNFYCKLRFFFLIASDTNICMSGWAGKGACHGDSGGPMVHYDEKDGKPTLVGITSFGFGFACNWSWPSAYTRVTSYLDWVNAHINA